MLNNKHPRWLFFEVRHLMPFMSTEIKGKTEELN